MKSQSPHNAALFHFASKGSSLFLLLLCFISACSSMPDKELQKTAQKLAETPTPNYIVENRFDPDDNQLCTVISQEHLWQPGDNAPALTYQITRSAKTYLNNIEVKSSFKTYNEYYPVSVDGKLVGTYGGNIWICFDKQGITKGIHIATIKFKTSSGQEHSYSWSFTIS